MAKIIYQEPSRTLMEMRLLPRLTSSESTIEKVSLTTKIAQTGNNHISINIPIISAAMQSVSGTAMGIELAKQGGLACIFASQSIEAQADMIYKIKTYKAGFVEPKAIYPDMLIKDLYEFSKKLKFTTFPVINSDDQFLGLITKNDYDVTLHGNLQVNKRMIPATALVVGKNINDLKEANKMLMESHQSVLPVIDENDNLKYLVFRKDIQNHLYNPNEVVDEKKRLLTCAAINTHDYKERATALVKANVDIIAIDSSDGHTSFQKDTICWIRKEHKDLPIIGGNIITEDGFNYLVSAGASAIKIGMGGGSICITQEQKGTGRGLATSIIKVCEARDKYFKETGKYIPLIADGGITSDKDIIIALALGADAIMMGRYFARMEESPTEKLMINNRVMKPYWGEGSSKARKWQELRYHQSKFVEGVEGYVEYAGKLKEVLEETLAKIKASMSTCGAASIKEFHETALLEIMSPLSIREGGVHDIYQTGYASNENVYGNKW